jgi:hypothetical protein
MSLFVARSDPDTYVGALQTRTKRIWNRKTRARYLGEHRISNNLFMDHPDPFGRMDETSSERW